MRGFTYGPQTYTFNFLRRKIVKIAKKMQFSALEIQEKWDRFRSAYSDKHDRQLYEVLEEEAQKEEKIHMRPDFFYPWECVSFHDSTTTYDFVIKDRVKMFALLQVLNHFINKVPLRRQRQQKYCCTKQFLWLRFKMRLGYEAWRQHMTVAKMFKYAVHLTVH